MAPVMTSISFRTHVSALFFIICFFKVESSFIKDGRFYISDVCDITNRLNDQCMVHETQVERALDCGRLCTQSKQSMCVAFSTMLSEESGTLACYLHRPCDNGHIMYSGNCTEDDAEYTHYIRLFSDLEETSTCGGSGKWSYAALSCSCSNGYIGGLCDRIASSCEELSNYGYALHQRHMVEIKPADWQESFLTLCQLTTGGVRTYVAVSDYAGGFNRSWEEYSDGFIVSNLGGHNNLIFWLGLERMHHLTSQRDFVLVMIFLFKVNNGPSVKLFFEYTSVTIGDASTNYLFSYNTLKTRQYPLTAIPDELSFEDPMRGQNGLDFSTPDADHDANPDERCANISNTGWWFYDCPEAPSHVFSPLDKLYALKATYTSTMQVVSMEEIANYGGPLDRLWMYLWHPM